MARSHRHGRGDKSLLARDSRGEAHYYRTENGVVRQWTRESRRAADDRALSAVRRASDPAEVDFDRHRGTEGRETW